MFAGVVAGVVEKQPPARPGNAHRDAAHQHQQQDFPPDACSGVAAMKRSRPDRKPDETGDFDDAAMPACLSIRGFPG